MPLGDIARTEVVTAAPSTPAPELAWTLGAAEIGCLVIVGDGGDHDEDGHDHDEDGHDHDAVAGIVTDRDLALRALDREDPSSVTAAELMTPDPVTATPQTGVYEAMQQLREANVRRLPIVDDGRVVGIVTLDDLVVLLAEELSMVADVVRGGSPPY